MAGAGAVVALFLVQAGAFNALQPQLTIAPAETAGTTASSSQRVSDNRADQATVSGSQFTGFDKQRQPFSVRAERAVQDTTDASKVYLERVVAELTRNSGEEIAISSLTALYDADKKSIDLDGKVELSSRDQFVATMAKAKVTIDDKRLLSEVPVTVRHKRGEIHANGMAISDEGRRIVFFNRVRATFWGNREDGQQ
jgi:lipopolysaccharide export system protein LptC